MHCLTERILTCGRWTTNAHRSNVDSGLVLDTDVDYGVLGQCACSLRLPMGTHRSRTSLVIFDDSTAARGQVKLLRQWNVDDIVADDNGVCRDGDLQQRDEKKRIGGEFHYDQQAGQSKRGAVRTGNLAAFIRAVIDWHHKEVSRKQNGSLHLQFHVTEIFGTEQSVQLSINQSGEEFCAMHGYDLDRA